MEELEEDLMNVPTLGLIAKHEQLLKVLKCMELAKMRIRGHRKRIDEIEKQNPFYNNIDFYENRIRIMYRAIAKLRRCYVSLQTNEYNSNDRRVG